MRRVVRIVRVPRAAARLRRNVRVERAANRREFRVVRVVRAAVRVVRVERIAVRRSTARFRTLVAVQQLRRFWTHAATRRRLGNGALARLLAFAHELTLAGVELTLGPRLPRAWHTVHRFTAARTRRTAARLCLVERAGAVSTAVGGWRRLLTRACLHTGAARCRARRPALPRRPTTVDSARRHETRYGLVGGAGARWR